MSAPTQASSEITTFYIISGPVILDGTGRRKGSERRKREGGDVRRATEGKLRPQSSF